MIVSDVSLFLKNEEISNKKIAVAISGGADSVALFFALYELKESFSLQLALVHVNYQLRGQASEDECNYIRQLAEQYNVESFIEIAPLSGSGIEEKARSVRYRLFKSVMEEHGYDHVAVGHTRDDQAETVLFRLLRGCSVHGASGMDAVRRDGIIRPLLYGDRALCKSFLLEKNISWFEDESNSDSIYKRNLIRNEILPLLKQVNNGAVEHIAQFGHHCRSVSEGMITDGMVLLNERDLWSSEKVFHFHKGDRLTKTEVAAIAELLRERKCSFTELHMNLLGSACDHAGKETLLPSGWRVFSSYSRIVFYHESSDPFSAFTPFSDLEQLSSALWGLYSFDPSTILHFRGKVRNVRENDAICLGNKEKRVIDILRKKGVPSRQRNYFPVLEDYQGTVYIPTML